MSKWMLPAVVTGLAEGLSWGLKHEIHVATLCGIGLFYAGVLYHWLATR